MNIIFYLANALVLPPAMFFAWNFYKFKGKEINFRSLWMSSGIFSLTFIVTSLQFVFPEIIKAFDRNGDALLAGEVWRLVTPLFIQPMGIWQCAFNGLFFISFLPVAEHFYSRRLLIIYFATGIAGQLFNFYWESTGGGLSSTRGGSSTAIYGVMGSLYMYIILNRKTFPKGYILLPIAGFVGATILCFFKDGHAPSVLVGGILALILRRYSRQITPYPPISKLVNNTTNE